MRHIKAFGAFWYDFIVGDDWHVAALVVAGLARYRDPTHAAKVNAWWLLPIVGLAALAWSLHRATAPQVKSIIRTGSRAAVAPPFQCDAMRKPQTDLIMKSSR